jgi:hypothetical protein
MYVLSVQYSCAVVLAFVCGGKANLVLLTLFYSTLLALTDRQMDRDFLFSWNNLLAKTYFLWNPNFLLLHISFFFSINQHHYNHDHFSKIQDLSVEVEIGE